MAEGPPKTPTTPEAANDNNLTPAQQERLKRKKEKEQARLEIEANDRIAREKARTLDLHKRRFTNDIDSFIEENQSFFQEKSREEFLKLIARRVMNRNPRKDMDPNSLEFRVYEVLLNIFEGYETGFANITQIESRLNLVKELLSNTEEDLFPDNVSKFPGIPSDSEPEEE